MLPKKHRVKRSHFNLIFNKGKTLHSNYFVLVIYKNSEISQVQAAVIASSKVGKATQRNRAKRLIREIIRLEISNIQNQIQIIIICKQSINNTNFNDLKKELISKLKEAGLYKK